MEITPTKDEIVESCISSGKDELRSSSPKEQPTSSSSSPPQQQPNEMTPPESTSRNNNNEASSTKDNERSFEDSQAKKDDSSSFSTAFTISFEDESNAAKRLSIKDSIRKFAPPKPNSIEKPRQPKTDQLQDTSLNSIESAPGGLAKHSPRFERSSAKRSSERRSNSSMHSNISDSAAFLIDKMLNPSQQQLQIKDVKSLPPKSPRSRNFKEQSPKTHAIRETPTTTSRIVRAADSMLDGEVDFSEDKSDNGTYIVGADPESEAARKKIDELFGVVKAAEESVIAESASRQLRNEREHSRRSRASDKKPINRERQERIDRLARRSTSASRSSSSSRHDNASAERPPRGTSRNSSCDRTSSKPHYNRPRRSTSQSSRQSSGREPSEGDTRSSKSSLQNDNDTTSHENQLLSHPSMKFNRAFALRRARLGLGEPIRNIPVNQNLSQEPESMQNLNSTSQRGTPISVSSYRASPSQSAGSANFSRDDGGRFSLRMRNTLQPVRNLTGVPDRAPQHNSVLESMINRVTGSKSSVSNQYRSMMKPIPYASATASSVPYQSSDEQEALSPSRYRTVIKSVRLPRKAHSELDHEEGSPLRRLNCSAGNDNESVFRYENRAGGSAGARGSNALQLGALDSLVISAISSLSLKIRQSVCDVLIEQAKKLPDDNETRLVVEEILPQLLAPSSGPKSPTSIEEIDQSLYFDLAKTLKNLKKVEQMVEVINLISNQLTSSTSSSLNNSSNLHSVNRNTGTRSSDSAIAQKTSNSMNDLSPV